jgi:4-hydroxy-tetrahydrodipicolinate synthase
MFKGSIVALITPFTENNTVDTKALEELILWHLECKTDAIVLAGTTGECPTLSHEEKLHVFSTGIKAAAGRVPIIAGTGTNCTRSSVALTKQAKELGVDGCMAVVPYYNRPNEEGCFLHFENIANIGLPTIVYHHPKRTGTVLQPSFFSRLETIPYIVSIKEASCDMAYFEKQRLVTSLDILSGDDNLTIAMMQKGAGGVISVIANVFPQEWKQMISLCQKKQFDEAINIKKALQASIDCMGIETNPQPVKYAVSLLNRCKNIFRLPLVSPSEKSKKIIEESVLNTNICV